MIVFHVFQDDLFESVSDEILKNRVLKNKIRT